VWRKKRVERLKVADKRESDAKYGSLRVQLPDKGTYISENTRKKTPGTSRNGQSQAK